MPCVLSCACCAVVVSALIKTIWTMDPEETLGREDDPEETDLVEQVAAGRPPERAPHPAETDDKERFRAKHTWTIDNFSYCAWDKANQVTVFTTPLLKHPGVHLLSNQEIQYQLQLFPAHVSEFWLHNLNDWNVCLDLITSPAYFGAIVCHAAVSIVDRFGVKRNKVWIRGRPIRRLATYALPHEKPIISLRQLLTDADLLLPNNKLTIECDIFFWVPPALMVGPPMRLYEVLTDGRMVEIPQPHSTTSHRSYKIITSTVLDSGVKSIEHLWIVNDQLATKETFQYGSAKFELKLSSSFHHHLRDTYRSGTTLSLTLLSPGHVHLSTCTFSALDPNTGKPWCEETNSLVVLSPSKPLRCLFFNRQLILANTDKWATGGAVIQVEFTLLEWRHIGTHNVLFDPMADED